MTPDPGHSDVVEPSRARTSEASRVTNISVCLSKVSVEFQAVQHGLGLQPHTEPPSPLLPH